MWPFKKRNRPFGAWPIIRTKPDGRKYGRAIPLFINNWQCHLTTVDVYEDGAVDCWGFVDLDLFRQKLRSRWVVANPIKADQQISVFHFGLTGVRNAEWWQTPATIADEVDSIVSMLNPRRKDLIDMQGSDVETRGKVRFTKMGLSDEKPYRLAAVDKSEVLGKSISIFRVRPNQFELTNLFVFADGLMQVGPDGKLLPLENLRGLYEAGEVANHAPAGSRIVIPGLGAFDATADFGGVSHMDRIMELNDMLNQLQGKPGVTTLCVQAYETYKNDPTPERKELLRESYGRVPTHLKCYCGDMDTRDSDIIKVLNDEN